MTDIVVAAPAQLIPLNGTPVDPKVVLLRYLSDETTKDIAASYGVTRQALGQFLLKNAETEWKDAQVARALARKESAEDDLETAADALSLARARERLRAAQWDLERVCRRIYGQDAPPAGTNAVQININLRRVNEPGAVGSGLQAVLSGSSVGTNQDNQ